MINQLLYAFSILVTFLGLTLTPETSAQSNWPSKPIRLIVPFAAGGATDQVARLISVKISTALGTNVIVENRPGANGNIGADFVSKSSPDGYTFLHTTSAIAFTAAFKQKVGYDLEKDLQPVSLVIHQPLLIMSSLQSGILDASSLKEFIKINKHVAYGSSGNGNLTHLAMYVILNSMTKNTTHVPYKGGAAAFPDFIAGRFDLFADPINSAYPYVNDKRVTALAVTSEKRSSLAPQVPSVSESLLPGFTMSAWQGLLAPANTLPDIINRIQTSYAKALNDSDVKNKLASQGAESVGSTSEDFKKFMQLEIVRWEKIVQFSGITAD